MSYATAIRPHVSSELEAAESALRNGQARLAFTHLERAHVLGQPSTGHHVRVHWAMLVWGLKQRNLREVFGQIFRLVGAASKTFIGLVPTGNTGGTNVSPIKPLPIPADLQSVITQARLDA